MSMPIVSLISFITFNPFPFLLHSNILIVQLRLLLYLKKFLLCIFRHWAVTFLIYRAKKESLATDFQLSLFHGHFFCVGNKYKQFCLSKIIRTTLFTSKTTFLHWSRFSVEDISAYFTSETILGCSSFYFADSVLLLFSVKEYYFFKALYSRFTSRTFLRSCEAVFTSKTFLRFFTWKTWLRFFTSKTWLRIFYVEDLSTFFYVEDLPTFFTSKTWPRFFYVEDLATFFYVEDLSTVLALFLRLKALQFLRQYLLIYYFIILFLYI